MCTELVPLGLYRLLKIIKGAINSKLFQEIVQNNVGLSCET